MADKSTQGDDPSSHTKEWDSANDTTDPANTDATQSSSVLTPQPARTMKPGNTTPPDTGKRIGMFMIAGLWLLLLGFAALWAHKHLEFMRNPNASPVTISQGQEKQVVLQMNRYGHYVAGGFINGEAVTFLLDTGATAVSLSEKLASQLGLKRGQPVKLLTANGSITGYSVTLDSVAIGDLERVGVAAYINPGMGAGEVLLGMSYLRHFKLTQEGGTLTLEQ